MKTKSIVATSSIFVIALVLLLSLKVQGVGKTKKTTDSDRYVELKIQDKSDEKIVYNVYALSPTGDPVLLLERSDFKNEFLTLKIPNDANYFMIQRIDHGRKKRELFKIDPLRTVVSYNDASRRIGSD